MGDPVEPRRSKSPQPASAGDDEATKARQKSELHAATTHVTIAWPFSQIRLQEASSELAELASLLGDLVAALGDLVPEDRLAPLRDRLEALRARLR